MEVPRRLYLSEDGEICEEGDPRARFLLSGKGGVMTEAEAQRVGLLAYLAKALTPDDPEPAAEAPEAKMVEQATVEDKAVAAPAAVKAQEPPASPEPTDESGQTPETRRTGGGRRGA